MTLSTYTELQETIAQFLNRDDLNVHIPDFIKLAESQTSRILRHWRSIKRSTSPTSGQYLEVPNDWVENESFDIMGDGTSRLTLVGHAVMSQKRADAGNTSGRPRFYSMVGGEFEFYPTPDAVYETELTYYAWPLSLGDTVPTNWLLEQSPDVYLYGALMHSAPFLQEDNRLAVWAALYSSAVDSLQKESNDAKYSGTAPKMNIRM
jgi:hypothetical protein